MATSTKPSLHRRHKPLDDYLRQLGANLKSAREARGEDYNRVARMLRRTPGFIRKVEEGKARHINLQLIIELCTVYEVDPLTILPTEPADYP